MLKRDLLNQRDKIITQLKEYVPLIAPFFDLDMSIREYSKWLAEFEIDRVQEDRQRLIKEIITNKVIKLWGEEAPESMGLRFDKRLAFNIADHHQILSHPFLLSSNLISSADKYSNKADPSAIVVISSGDVPPNNYFSKGGFFLHGKKVPLFSVSERESTSYYIPKRDFGFVRRARNSELWKNFDANEQKFLEGEQQKINSLDFSRCENYIDQISIVVKGLWPRIFDRTVGKIPELIYITQEELITECLINILNEKNIISDTLFDPKLRENVLENFRGNVITWREGEQKGTHFFWRKYPGQPRSLRMYVEGDFLVPVDRRFASLKVRLNSGEIIGLLKTREIYPSLFTIFSVLNTYAGVRPLTGYGSAVYLELFKQAWIKTLTGTIYEKENERIAQVDTTGMVAGLVLFYRKYQEKLRTLYAHDIFCDGAITKDYLDMVMNMRFSDVIKVGVAEMYEYYANKYIPVKKRLRPNISFDDLASFYFDWI